MKKIHLVGLMLLIVGAFSAFTSASAFALTFEAAQWLEGGAAIAANRAATTEGELLFENVLNGAAFLCSGKFDGTVGANGADEITEVLTLGNVKVVELDEEKATGGIACSPLKLCTSAEIWPVNLPFKSELMLDTEGGFYDLVIANANGKIPAYFLLCIVLGIDATELCETVEGAFGAFGEVSNTATDVETLGALSPLATCGGNAEDGLIENNAENVALISLNSGATLAASE